MEVMHAGFVLNIIEWITGHIYVVVWLIAFAVVLRFLFLKTHITRFFAVLIALVVSIVFIRVISKEWFEAFVAFWSGKGQ